MQAKDRLGRFGESLAVGYLERAGMAVLDRNWRCDQGEIDIVARDGDTLVVCEVKTRSGERYGSPLEGVTPAKLGRLYRLAACWLAAHGLRPREVRVDVVGILRDGERAISIDHLRGVR
ncbi:MAG TPA: YraN family protein [Actinopolymorphaceae bacterium]